MVDRDEFADYVVRAYGEYVARLDSLVSQAEKTGDMLTAARARGACSLELMILTLRLNDAGAMLGDEVIAGGLSRAVYHVAAHKPKLATLAQLGPLRAPSHHIRRDGSRIAAELQVRLLARKAAIDAELAAAIRVGRRFVTVEHDSPDHRHHGITVDLEDREGLARIFHPNSNARIADV